MKKQFLTFLIFAPVTLSFIGCGGGAPESDPASDAEMQELYETDDYQKQMTGETE